MSDLKKNTKNILKRNLTIIIILIIIISGLTSLLIYVIQRNNNVKSAALLESAYDKIEQFDELPNVYSKQDMETEIINLLEKVITNYPNTESGKRASFYKGYIYYNTNNYEKSIESFKLYLSKFKNFYLTPKAYYMLSYCYSDTEKIDEALKTLFLFDQKFSSSYIKPLALYRIAELYEKKNEKENAIKYYNKILSEAPDSTYKEYARNKVFLLTNNVEL